jgi:DNA-binding NtrC family response regulator
LQERSVDRVGGRNPVPIDVRIIAATNRNLEASMRDKQFRDDLYYRLSVVRIQTPALREIADDIPILANYFLQKHCAAMGLDAKQFAPDAMDRLVHYDWPGNARQLENETKRLLASVRGKTITVDYLGLPSVRGIAKEPEPPPPSSPAERPLYEAVEALERKMIQAALNACSGNKLKAAQRLGLSRQGLFKKLKKLGLSSA